MQRRREVPRPAGVLRIRELAEGALLDAVLAAESPRLVD